jgi:hypothetical protein
MYLVILLVSIGVLWLLNFNVGETRQNLYDLAGFYFFIDNEGIARNFLSSFATPPFMSFR